ncbi:uncharacterized protein [Miscanthus floridulus]|uniref:uncharacterized protein n=1 Tax=Miscanthus floridulus TaxID=154761 RepID=UPI0034583178
MIAALHAHLQQAAATAHVRGKAEEEGNEAAASYDAESCFTKPGTVVEIAQPPLAVARPRRTCRLRSASVVLLPCRHLCAPTATRSSRLAPCRAAFEASALLAPVTAV